MKTPEEHDALTRELEALNKKLAELNEEELEEVSGGMVLPNEYNVFIAGAEILGKYKFDLME